MPWWNEIKRLSGIIPAMPTEDIRAQLLVEGLDGRSNKNIAELIKTALLELMQEYQSLDSLPPVDKYSEVPTLDESSLGSLSISKAKPSKSLWPRRRAEMAP